MSIIAHSSNQDMVTRDIDERKGVECTPIVCTLGIMQGISVMVKLCTTDILTLQMIRIITLLSVNHFSITL